MKKNVGKYRQVTELPLNALTVLSYSQQRQCTTNYIYNLIAKGKADFEMVVFQGVNFVLPN